MHWIYILKCYKNGNCISYVGETKRLYSRFWEHVSGQGGTNTFIYTPRKLVAIYKVSEISKFIDYNEKVMNINIDKNLEWTYQCGFNNPHYVLNNWDYISDESDYISCENNIAECLMIHNKNNWENVRGGKYVRFDCTYKFPNNDHIKELPLCNCGLPCDVKKHKQKNSLYFRCAKKNMWDDLKENFEDYLDCIEDPCNFYEEYLTDIELRIGKKKEFENRKKQLKELFCKSQWLKNIHGDSSDPYGKCVGNCGKLNSDYKYIQYYGRWRTLCYDCFIDKNDELKQNYDKPDVFSTGKCLIVDVDD